MCFYASIFLVLFFFFFNDTATTEIYTLSLHDALPISPCSGVSGSLRKSSGPRVSQTTLRQASCRCAGGTSLVRIKMAIRIAPPAAGLTYGSNDAPRRSSSSSHGSCPPGKGIPDGARYSRISHPRNQEED